MTDEGISMSMRTWTRAVDSVNKVGYSDGVTDGQAATYQTSFDTGYEQGLNFGFNLGIMDSEKEAMQREDRNLRDPRGINCQICLNNHYLEENTVNLINLQKEKNDDYLRSEGLNIQEKIISNK